MSGSPQDRRKTQRRGILDQFSFYVSIPHLGNIRLKVNDVSEMGIGFTVDTLGEFKLKKDEQTELHFYLNQSLFLPLKIQVVRFFEQDETQNVGAVFLDTTSSQYQTLITLVKLLDQLVDFGVVKQSQH